MTGPSRIYNNNTINRSKAININQNLDVYVIIKIKEYIKEDLMYKNL